MSKVAITVTTRFGFSHDAGVTVTYYAVGAQDVDEEVANVGVAMGAATLAKASKDEGQAQPIDADPALTPSKPTAPKPATKQAKAKK